MACFNFPGFKTCPFKDPNYKISLPIPENLVKKYWASTGVLAFLPTSRLNPKYVHAMNNLGNILKERNELQEAEELLSLAVQIQ